VCKHWLSATICQRRASFYICPGQYVQERQRLWSSLSPGARQQFTYPDPGQPRQDHDKFKSVRRRGWARHRMADAYLPARLARFCITAVSRPWQWPHVDRVELIMWLPDLQEPPPEDSPALDIFCLVVHDIQEVRTRPLHCCFIT
jgi:hypothetical protein